MHQPYPHTSLPSRLRIRSGYQYPARDNAAASRPRTAPLSSAMVKMHSRGETSSNLQIVLGAFVSRHRRDSCRISGSIGGVMRQVKAWRLPVPVLPDSFEAKPAAGLSRRVQICYEKSTSHGIRVQIELTQGYDGQDNTGSRNHRYHQRR